MTQLKYNIDYFLQQLPKTARNPAVKDLVELLGITRSQLNKIRKYKLNEDKQAKVDQLLMIVVYFRQVHGLPCSLDMMVNGIDLIQVSERA